MIDLDPRAVSELAERFMTLFFPLVVIVARPLGLFLIFPVFTRVQLGQVAKGALALVLVVPAMPRLVGEVQASGVTGVVLAAYTVKEALIGGFIGILLALPFWAIQAMGELVDTQRGITNSDIQDPATQAQGAVTGLFLGLISATVFVSAGGLMVVADVLYRSYAVWPVMRLGMTLSPAGMDLVASILDYIFRYGIALGGPILILMLLTDVSLAFLSRAAPQVVTQDLAPTVKNLIFVAFAIVYGTFVISYLGDEMVRLGVLGARLEGLLE